MGGEEGRLAFQPHPFAAVSQPQPPPLPAPNASTAERVAWGLGDGPSPVSAGEAVSTAPWSPGGTYGAQDIDYVESLQDHDESAPAAPGVQRVAVNFGEYVTGSLLFQTVLLSQPPPSPAGWPAVVWLGGLDYNKVCGVSGGGWTSADSSLLHNCRAGCRATRPT